LDVFPWTLRLAKPQPIIEGEAWQHIAIARA